MDASEILSHYRSACLAAIDRRHPAFADLRWSLPADELVAEVARRSRAAVVGVEVSGLTPEDPPSGGNHYAQRGETAGSVIERCLAGRWCSVGAIYELADGVEYTESPDPAQNTRGCPFGEWTWQLNRHWEWRLAARLFVGTGEARYADAALGWIQRWLETCPPPAFDLNAHHASWRTIEIGIRLAAAWTDVLSVFADRFDDELWLAWLGAWALQAPFAYQHRKHNNWLHMEMNGLIHAGVALPFMRDAARWRELGLAELEASFERQVHPDGMQFELSTGYHQVCISNLERPAQRLRAAGYPLPDGFEQGIARMYQPYRVLARPDRRCWGFQDSGFTPTTVLAQLPEEHRQPGDAWLIDGSGEPPTARHGVLPHAGYAVLRSGWSEDALCLAFDGGPYGASHQHEDKLSFQLCAHGTDLIGEAGTVAYADSPQRRYCLTTLAHSTAVVDGQGQSRGFGFDQSAIDLAAPADLRCDLGAAQPWAESSYIAGYGPERIAVRHHRRITLVADDLVAVSDRFEAEDEAEHRVELLFHLLLPAAEVVDGGVATRGEGGNCALVTRCADAVIHGRLERGDEAVDLRGWAASPGRGFTLEALPCWTVATDFSATLELETLIRVTPPGALAVSPAQPPLA